MITKEYPSKCQTRYSATEHEALSRGPGGRSNTAKHKDERKPRARALAATSVFRGTCVLDTCPVQSLQGSAQGHAHIHIWHPISEADHRRERQA